MIELLLTPAGRARWARRWAALPKWVRSGLTAAAFVFADLLVLAFGGWVTFLLGNAGYVLAAVISGCATFALATGGVIAAIMWGEP